MGPPGGPCLPEVPDVGGIVKTEKVSLADELAAIAEVLESAQLIAELLATNAMPDEYTSERAPKMLEAVLALAVARVRLLRKVVIGAADVRLLVGRNNRAGVAHAGDDPDVHLPSSPRSARRRR